MNISERKNYAIKLAAETVYEHWKDRREHTNLGEIAEDMIATYDDEPLPFEIHEYYEYLNNMVYHLDDELSFFEAIKIEGGTWETE